MKKYEIWDRRSPINGIGASYYLRKLPFSDYKGDIILIYNQEGNKVTNVECKDILADVYGINKKLSLEEFMENFFAAIDSLVNQDIE